MSFGETCTKLNWNWIWIPEVSGKCLKQPTICYGPCSLGETSERRHLGTPRARAAKTPDSFVCRHKTPNRFRTGTASFYLAMYSRGQASCHWHPEVPRGVEVLSWHSINPKPPHHLQCQGVNWEILEIVIQWMTVKGKTWLWDIFLYWFHSNIFLWLQTSK